MFYREAKKRVAIARIIENSDFRTVRLHRDGRTFEVRVSEDEIDDVIREAGVDPRAVRLYATGVSRNEMAHIVAIDKLASDTVYPPPEIVEIVSSPDNRFVKQIAERRSSGGPTGFDFLLQQCDLAKILSENKEPPPPDPSRSVIRRFTVK